MTSIKQRIVRFATWAQKNWLALVVFLLCVMMCFVCAVMFSWLYGYWSNALWGTKFELASCWQGVGVIVTGLGGVAGLGTAACTKYFTDSKYNSLVGQKPGGVNEQSGMDRRV